MKLIIFCILCMACTSKPYEITYPETKRVHQKDMYFGTEVSDPYRWLENDTAKDVMEWVDKQNEVTFNYLKQIPYREKIEKRLSTIFNYERYSSPFRVGSFYIYSKNDGLQNQSVYYIQEGLNGKPEVLLDPNTLSTDGTVSAQLLSESSDNKYIGVNIQRSGSDWSQFKVMDIKTKTFIKDSIEWVKFSGMNWYKDGFFYSSYGVPIKGKEYSNKNEFHKVYYHKLGTPQSTDILIHENKQHPQRNFYADLSEDGRFLYIYESEGTSGTGILYKDLSVNGFKVKQLIAGFENEHTVIANIGNRILVRTNLNADNYKVIELDLKNPEPTHWKDIIPEQENLLRRVATSGNKLFTFYLKDAHSQVFQYNYQGQLEKEITLPGLGSAHGFWGKKDDETTFYTFSSFLTPNSIFKYTIASGKSTLFKKANVKVNTDNYVEKQVFYKSKDGTKVPMFIVHKKGLKLDGTNPTYLYGYGGFNVKLTPRFVTSNFILLENGGVYAMPNLRGGGEYGEQWHKDGMGLKKQNVFDDFIAAGEYLIENKYTSKEKLAIAGGSNGGLLVGAVMTQRPDLFKVAFPDVGVLDMLRYHKFTIGWAWAVEYGSSDEEKHFKNLLSYSPLHNIKDQTSYPATMVTTGDHDDRVVPAHSFKFSAQLQKSHVGNNPVLIRISKKAGHGSGKPISMLIKEQADKWAFMFYNMNETYH